MSRHENAEKPQRSCLGCRESKDNDQLIRYVLSPAGELVPDFDAKLPGRGAYTCIKSSCLAAAVKQRQFSRAFKCEVAVPAPEEMIAMVTGLLHDRILGLIGLANKAGKITGGGSMVCDSIRSSHKPGLVLIASDVSGAIGEKIMVLAGHNKVQYRSLFTKGDFGAILGKAPRSAIAVKTGGFVQQLVRAVDRYRNFLGEV